MRAFQRWFANFTNSIFDKIGRLASLASEKVITELTKHYMYPYALV